MAAPPSILRLQIHIFGIALVAGRSWLSHLFGRSSGAQLRSGDPSGPDNTSDIAPRSRPFCHMEGHLITSSPLRGERDARQLNFFCPISKCDFAPQLRLVRTAAIWRRRRRQRSPRRVFQPATARALKMVLILLFRSGNLKRRGAKAESDQVTSLPFQLSTVTVDFRGNINKLNIFNNRNT